jgi:hypothetical protein
MNDIENRLEILLGLATKKTRKRFKFVIVLKFGGVKLPFENIVYFFLSHTGTPTRIGEIK